MPYPKNLGYQVSGVALTQSGRELLRIVDLAPMNDYTQVLIDFSQTKKLHVTEVDGPLPKN